MDASPRGEPDRFDELLAALRPQRDRLLRHGVYAKVQDLGDLAVFMEHHVFAVWDFMSLLKALQRGLTCTDLPWVPRGGVRARRWINELVLGEESDEVSAGEYASHFELYREAMHDVGARTESIDALVALAGNGEPLRHALVHAQAPLPARAFVQATFSFVESDSLPAIAAAFTLGREDVIPEMFRELVAALTRGMPGRCERFQLYLERHIELDGGAHGRLARELLMEVCGSEPERWHESQEAGKRAIQARIALWDGVQAAIGARRAGPPLSTAAASG
jgi:pyrroloquinoline quinone (PQQ) biosynthesis protein C